MFHYMFKAEFVTLVSLKVSSGRTLKKNLLKVLEKQRTSSAELNPPPTLKNTFLCERRETVKLVKFAVFKEMVY